MKTENLFITLFLCSIIILVAFASSGCAEKQGKYDALAQCLSSKNTVMYGTAWCSHCQNQKKSFGTSFQYVNFVDCDKSANTCAEANITGYPTWIVNGIKYEGEQNMYELAKNSGCLGNLTN